MPAARIGAVKRCKKHRSGRYSAQFDTYYCDKCDRWLEAVREPKTVCAVRHKAAAAKHGMSVPRF